MANSKMSSRNNNIGVLHFIAALFVMYGHQCALLGFPAPVLLGTQIHTIGVKIIFIISGYLITQSLWSLKGTRLNVAKSYLMKRLSRIYPELIGCLLMSAFIIGPLFTNLAQTEYWNDAHYLHYITANIRMYPLYSLPGVFTDNPYPNAVNGSLWTLPVELLLYIFILVIFLISNKPNVKGYVYSMFSFILLVLFLVRIALFPKASLVFYGTDWLQGLNIIPYFLIGGIAKLFSFKKFLNVQISAALLVSVSWISFESQFLNELVCLVVLTYFVLSLSLADEQHLHFRWIKSEYAYGMYLYGFVVQQCIISIFCVDTLPDKWLAFILSVIFTYVLAMLSYRIFYVPVKKIMKRK